MATCKLHNDSHEYTRHICGHEYCSIVWHQCPRCATAPAVRQKLHAPMGTLEVTEQRCPTGSFWRDHHEGRCNCMHAKEKWSVQRSTIAGKAVVSLSARAHILMEAALEVCGYCKGTPGHDPNPVKTDEGWFHLFTIGNGSNRCTAGPIWSLIEQCCKAMGLQYIEQCPSCLADIRDCTCRL